MLEIQTVWIALESKENEMSRVGIQIVDVRVSSDQMKDLGIIKLLVQELVV